MPTFYVKVDSINSGENVANKSFIILPGVKDFSVNDLHFKEYAKYVKRAFEAKGYTIVEAPENAEVVVFMKYGISDPEEHSYLYSVPVWGQTGYSSSTTTGSTYSHGGITSYSETTTYTPNYGVVGNETRRGTYVTYFCYLVLNAYDFKAYRESEKEVQLWKTIITSSGSSGDLRVVVPILVAAAKPYIGDNTGKKIGIKIKEK